ncbi:hypothetical protein AAC387_Pa08g0748 [Persea americana]
MPLFAKGVGFLCSRLLRLTALALLQLLYAQSSPMICSGACGPLRLTTHFSSPTISKTGTAMICCNWEKDVCTTKRLIVDLLLPLSTSRGSDRSCALLCPIATRPLLSSPEVIFATRRIMCASMACCCSSFVVFSRGDLQLLFRCNQGLDLLYFQSIVLPFRSKFCDFEHSDGPPIDLQQKPSDFFCEFLEPLQVFFSDFSIEK